jgi:Trp operon repressor
VTTARKKTTMSKFKIEHGASKVNLVLLKTNIEDTISQDIDLLSTWSNNDRKYIVNELLRFALTQEEDFLKYKAGLSATVTRTATGAKSAHTPIKPTTESVTKTDATAAHA